MNERIKELKKQAMVKVVSHGAYGESENYWHLDEDKFAELIVEECRQVVADLYRNTPLELCGPLLTADEKIAEHFFRITK
jgi:hypothetical protein